MQPLRWCDEVDSYWSKKFYYYVQSQSWLKIFFTIFTISVDEVVAFPCSAIIGFVLYNWVGDGLAGAQLLRIFGDFGMVCLFEVVSKWLFGRERPPWMKRKKGGNAYAMPAEWWAFPSGHTARAVYGSYVIIHYADRSPWTTLGFQQAVTPLTLAVICYSWAILCGLSRVALGKHRLADVIVGGIMGLAIGASPCATLDLRGWGRFALAFAFTVQLAVVVSSARYRAMMPYWPGFAWIVVTFWLTFPYAM